MGPALYLVVGKERFLKQEFLRSLRQRFFPKGTDSGNMAQYHAAEHEPGEALDFLRTAPFLAEKRLAVLHEVESLPEDEKESFLQAALALPSTAVLVLVAEEGTPKKDPFLKELSLKASLISCYLPKDHELPSWIRSRAEKKGLKISGDVCRFLVERIGEDAASLDQAVEQLALKVSPRQSAELSDADALFGRSLSRDVFEFVEILLQGSSATALKSFAALNEHGTDALEILPLLASQIDRLRRARALLDRGWPHAEIARELKIHPFYIKGTLQTAGSMTEDRSRRLVDKLLSCEEAIKTGRSGARLAFEKFVAEVCV